MHSCDNFISFAYTIVQIDMNNDLLSQICLHFFQTYIHIYVLRTFNVVTFDTGTIFPAVSWNSLLAVAMMKSRHR
jgi:hypothetical protein